MAGPHIREAYNAKARGSTTGGSRKKGKAKKKTRAEQNGEEQIDSNAAIITPKTEESREIERKEKLLQEVRDRLEIPRLSTF